jgi:hypothetical protein
MSSQVWPAHPKPLPDELLSSWLVRIAQANGLKLQTFCDIVFGKEHQLWNRDIDRSAPHWLLASLAQHTQTPMSHVEQTTLTIYRDRLYRKHHCAGQLRWILSTGIYHRKRRRCGIQFCPQCLNDDDAPYFRTRWRVAVLTFCPTHRILLHDRCPACLTPLAYHRRELGRPKVTETGLLCLCHACDFDLRQANVAPYIPYDTSIQHMLGEIAVHIAGQNTDINLGHLDALHQFCKVMVSRRTSAHLAAHVAEALGILDLRITRGRQAFELRPIHERHHIIQLSAWLLADPHKRLTDAWQAKAIRCNYLTRDFKCMPPWYAALTDSFRRKRH